MVPPDGTPERSLAQSLLQLERQLFGAWVRASQWTFFMMLCATHPALHRYARASGSPSYLW